MRQRGDGYSFYLSSPDTVNKMLAAQATMFKVGDGVAVIHLHRAGKERRREAIRVDTVEKVTVKEIVTNKVKFNGKADFKLGDLRPCVPQEFSSF